MESEGKFISVFTLQENKRYGRTEIYTEDDTVKVSVLDDLVIDLATVFEE